MALSVEGARQGPVPTSFGARDDSLLPHVREQLGEYFAGRLQEFDADVVLHGTPFQVRVWTAVAPGLPRLARAETAHRIDVAGPPGSA